MSGHDTHNNPDPQSRRLRARHDSHGRGHGSTPKDKSDYLSGPHDGDAQAADESRSPQEAITSRSTEAEARDLLSLRRARRGDDAAFADLLRDNDSDIRRFVSTMVGISDTDEVTRSIYIKAYRGLPLAPSTSPRLWLLGIADGACRDRLRRRASTGRSFGPHETAPINEELDPDVRLALGLIDAVGLTVREAARLVPGGISRVRELVEVGRASLREGVSLDVQPAHSSDFWNDLGRRLLIERAAPATDSGSLGKSVDPTMPTPPAPTPAFSQSGKVAQGMARRVHERSPRDTPWRSIAIALGAVSVVALVVVVSLAVAKRASDRDSELGLTAAKVLNRLDDALTKESVISGTATISLSNDPRLPKGKYQFVRTSSGSYRVWTADGSVDESYDRRANQFTSVRSNGDTTTATIRLGVAPGPPSPVATTNGMIGDLLSNSVRLVRSGTGQRADTTTLGLPTASSSGSPEGSADANDVSTTTEPGPPGWIVVADLPKSRSVSTASGHLPGVGQLLAVEGDKVRLTASQSLVLPHTLELLSRDTPVFRIEFSNLEIGQALEHDALEAVVPEHAAITTTSSGFTTVGIDQARSIITRELRTPAALPDGFILESVAVHAQDQVAVFGYRYGSQQLTITMQPSPNGSPTIDPFGKASAGTSPRKVEISSGAFAGGQAWFDQAPINHLWLAHRGVLLTVAGDGSQAEITQVAASLQ